MKELTAGRWVDIVIDPVGAHTMRQPELHRQNLMELFEMHHGGVIRPHISARYRLADAAVAIADLQERRATGKVVVEIA